MIIRNPGDIVQTLASIDSLEKSRGRTIAVWFVRKCPQIQVFDCFA